ncbi:unnamed protein product [Eruca vesicaria subsp. sativa]|uniref:Uncharacterized protein n=1 Tax=Eruca vesicaria subsp. sativa TaxID=29727 RepID=A0ABC8K9V0_ERUVS|nr:unnamed protein product [Eruca vesicaria subsp. sativa]
MSEITRLMQEEVTLGEVPGTREEEEFSDDKLVLDICWKRKRSDEKEEKIFVEKDNNEFKTPTRPENRILKVRQCPPAPTKGVKIYRGKTISCRRQLSFPPKNAVSSFITDLQWRTIKRERDINISFT